MYKNSRKRKNKHFTFIQINNRKRSIKNHLKYAKKNKRNYFVNGRLKKDLLYKVVNSKNEKFIKSMSILLGISAVAVIFVSIFFLRYIKGITTELPSPDNPFRGKDQTSIIYASNDNENGEKEILYTVFGEENRELVKIEEVPEIVKWSVLAAEDIDFYNHSGVDPGGVYKAATNYFLDTGESRGGSTITQQLIKQTTLGDEYSVDRKFREMLLAMEVEKLYSKDQILEMYLNVNNYGSNVYGIKTAAKFYFGKELSELTLSEAAIIARIPQSPVANSPTLSPDPKEGQKKALEGREYILSQIENNLDKVNSFIQNDSNLFNLEKIQAAREEIPSYLQPKISIQAPHFVFYVEEVLTTKPYNNGTPFTLNELQSGGYRIYTTLDTNIQEVALKNVQDGVNRYGMPYGGHNAAAVVTDPKTGDVLAMVGSKSYDSQSEGTKFDGKVNVTTSLQSMGSTMKPMAYYKAFELGVSSPGAFLPDVPINLYGYKPQNWDGRFKGTAGSTARAQLRESRNIPSILLMDAMGIENYANTAINFGYKSLESRKNSIGYSIVLGGGEVTMLEHAQGYGVFANGGNLVEIDPIKKITRIDPETGTETMVYEKTIEPKKVADERAIFLVNDILNYKKGGPGAYIDGRDFAGKTGTSESHKDNSFAGYSPDLVIIGWNGNNDNSPLSYGAWGVNVAKPWVINMAKDLAQFFPEKTSFALPGGIGYFNGDFSIQGIIPNQSYFNKFVPKKEQDRLSQ